MKLAFSSQLYNPASFFCNTGLTAEYVGHSGEFSYSSTSYRVTVVICASSE